MYQLYKQYLLKTEMNESVIFKQIVLFFISVILYAVLLFFLFFFNLVA